jgi:hypothetical protein
MLQQPIPRVKFIKWAYALIEYDLIYKSLRAMISEVISDFIVAHRIKDESHINYVSVFPRKLRFDGSVCREGQGISDVLISRNNVVYETSVYLNISY